METRIHPRFIFGEPTSIDWARLAAFIDGEGCITISRMVNKSRRTASKWTSYGLMVQITNTDMRLNVWLGRFDQDASYKKKSNVQSSFPNALPQHSWTVRGWKAHRILVHCLPYFVLKLDQAERGIAFQESKWQWGRGTKVSPEVKAAWDADYHKLRELKTPPSEWKEIIQ